MVEGPGLSGMKVWGRTGMLGKMLQVFRGLSYG